MFVKLTGHDLKPYYLAASKVNGVLNASVDVLKKFPNVRSVVYAENQAAPFLAAEEPARVVEAIERVTSVPSLLSNPQRFINKIVDKAADTGKAPIDYNVAGTALDPTT